MTGANDVFVIVPLAVGHRRQHGVGLHEGIAVQDDGDGFARRPAAAGERDRLARGVVGQVAGDRRDRLRARVNASGSAASRACPTSPARRKAETRSSRLAGAGAGSHWTVDADTGGATNAAGRHECSQRWRPSAVGSLWSCGLKAGRGNDSPANHQEELMIRAIGSYSSAFEMTPTTGSAPCSPSKMATGAECRSGRPQAIRTTGAFAVVRPLQKRREGATAPADARLHAARRSSRLACPQAQMARATTTVSGVGSECDDTLAKPAF